MQQDSRTDALDLLRQSVAGGVDEKMLSGKPLLDDVFISLFAEQTVYLGVMDKGDPIKLLHAAQSDLSQALQKVGDSGDLETILRAERLVLDNERTYYADTRPRNRIGDLPKDEARQFFKSHRARLENLEKARLMGLDKALIAVRKNNLNVASGGYIELQKIALASPEPEPESRNNYDGPG